MRWPVSRARPDHRCTPTIRGSRSSKAIAVAAAAITFAAAPAQATPNAASRPAGQPQTVGVAAAAALAPGNWTSTWGTAPSAAVPNVLTGFAGFTIRNVVHTTVAGARVRIHLSNRFGTAPVLMGHVTVALSAHTGGRTSDSVIDRSDGAAAGAVRDVLFNGRRSVTIPVGAEVVSDAVALAVGADRDLLVTTFTPQPSGTVSFHAAAQQDSFFANDRVDHASEPSAAAFGQVTRVWHYVSGVDVDGPGTVVALGDSITDGVTSTFGANRRWTDYLALRLRSQVLIPRYGVANAGISGNRILLDGNAPNHTIFDGSGPNALARISPDVLDRSNARSVVVLLGINDIQQTPHQTDPQQIIAGLAQLATQARSRGLRVIGATIMAWQGWQSFTPELEAVRASVNAWIRTGGGFDAVADFDAATRDPAQPTRLRPAFDSGDHLHPNDAGDRAMAAAVPLGVL